MGRSACLLIPIDDVGHKEEWGVERCRLLIPCWLHHLRTLLARPMLLRTTMSKMVFEVRQKNGSLVTTFSNQILTPTAFSAVK